MQVIEDSCFEQVGGRCKLKCDPPVSLLKGDIVVAERLKQIRQRRKEREELKRRRQEKNLALVRDFLASNNFDKEDLNAPKVECFGLRKCYPLQRAVKGIVVAGRLEQCTAPHGFSLQPSRAGRRAENRWLAGLTPPYLRLGPLVPEIVQGRTVLAVYVNRPSGKNLGIRPKPAEFGIETNDAQLL
ncbi:unnamed protein product [Effrenium voratum]|nr:unnamed protein product [Effrenium voratum]